MEEICREVGSRIRYIRRQKGYTLTVFAQELHRGKSTVSKYERGEISIDLATLSDISKLLGVSLSVLLDDGLTNQAAGFFRAGRDESAEHMEHYYLYLYASHEGKPYLARNALFIGEHSARIFAELPNDEEIFAYRSCYSGSARRTDSSIRIMVKNPVLPDDIIMLDFPVALKPVKALTGFFCSLSVGTWFPIASKALISAKPIRDDDWLRSQLTLTNDDLHSYKARNSFLVPKADFDF